MTANALILQADGLDRDAKRFEIRAEFARADSLRSQARRLRDAAWRQMGA